MINQKKILIVDDDSEVNDLVATMMKGMGHEPIQVDSAEAALEYLRNQSADLVLVDILLPNMDGWQLARVIRDDPRMKFTPMIMLTGSPTPTLDAMAMEVGANACLLKPYLSEKLEGLVTTVLDETR